MNSNAKNAGTSLNPSVLGATGKIRGPALPAGRIRAKSCYQHSLLLCQVRERASGAVRLRPDVPHMAVFHEHDFRSRALHELDWEKLRFGTE